MSREVSRVSTLKCSGLQAFAKKRDRGHIIALWAAMVVPSLHMIFKSEYSAELNILQNVRIKRKGQS